MIKSLLSPMMVAAASVLLAAVHADPAASASPFTGSGSASLASVAGGTAATISASFTDTGAALSGANADIEVYAPDGKKVGQKVFTGQNWSAGGTNKYTYDWTAPQVAGTYSVTLVVVSANWATQYFALYPATKITVTDAGKAAVKPLFTGSGSVSLPSVAAGAASTISVSLADSNTVLANTNVDIEVYDNGGKKVGQKVISGQNWSVGGKNKYSYDWTAPSKAGTYGVTLMVVSADWSTQYFALYPAAKISVTAP